MIIAMISVREASTRLPNKCLTHLTKNRVLEHVIRRCQSSGFIPVVSTTKNDFSVASICYSLGIKMYVDDGLVDDKLRRWKKTCQTFAIPRFVTVDCDDPLFDPDLTRQVYETPGLVRPDMNAYLGSHGWAFDYSHIEEMSQKTMSTHTEMIWHHIPVGMEVTQFNANPHPVEYNLRLTLDYEEDLWLLKTVIREIGPDARRADIIEFFQNNPGLRKINDFRNVEWKKRQSE